MEKEKLLKTIQSNIYFGKLTEKEVNDAIEQGLIDRLEDTKEDSPNQILNNKPNNIIKAILSLLCVLTFIIWLCY